MWPFKEKTKPIVIGVSGRSCSGKSTVVKKLEEKYKGKFLHINQDKFFKKKAENWEAPEALRNDKLIEALKRLKNNKTAFIPSHRWTEVFDREVKPHPAIIVEGYLLFTDKNLLNLFDKKVWVDVSDFNMLFRRLKRVGKINHLDHIKNHIIPESKKYESKQKKHADFIINGNKNEKEILEKLEQHLKKWKTI